MSNKFVRLDTCLKKLWASIVDEAAERWKHIVAYFSVSMEFMRLPSLSMQPAPPKIWRIRFQNPVLDLFFPNFLIFDIWTYVTFLEWQRVEATTNVYVHMKLESELSLVTVLNDKICDCLEMKTRFSIFWCTCHRNYFRLRTF